MTGQGTKYHYCIILGTRLSLDAIKRALQPIVRRKADEFMRERRNPLFKVNIVLAIPNIIIQPTVDEVQSAINKSVQMIVKMTENFPRWKHFIAQQEHQQKASLFVKKSSVNALSVHKITIFVCADLIFKMKYRLNLIC